MTARPDAMTGLLGIISNPATVQTINDRTLPDATESHVSANPGRTIGVQARYYDAMQARLNADAEDGASPPAAVAPFKPRNG